MDSDDPMVNTNQSEVVKTISSTNYPNDLKQNISNESIDEMWPQVNYQIPMETEICKEMESNNFTTKSLSNIDTNTANSTCTPVRGTKTQLRIFPGTSKAVSKPSKKSTGVKGNKKYKRVHFNSEVETYTYKSSMGILENYKYEREEISLENVVSDPFNNERGFRNPGISDSPWQKKTSTGISSRQSSIENDWDIYDERFHPLKGQYLPGVIYSKLKDQDSSDDSTKKLKNWPTLKKSKSCIFRKNNNDNNNESQNATSWNLSRRLSMSMHNLKLETKSWFDKLVTKVTKKKTENLPTQKSLYIDAGELACVSVQKPKIKQAGSLYQRKKWECGTSNLVHGNIFLRPLPSKQNLNLNRSFSLPDLSKIDSEDIIVDQENEVKSWTKFARKGGLFQRKRTKNKSEDKVNLRAWKSTKSLHYESKTLMDKFVSKLKRK